MSAFSDYLGSVNGVAVDVDGGYGAQCWDLWAHYAINLIGVAPARLTYTGAGGPALHYPGYTCNVWHKFNTSGLNQWFTPVSASQPAQPGDVAIWEYGSSAATPLSHIAVVVEDRGGSVYCMTQNPGPSHYGVITKAGLLGYLRPDNQSFFAAPPASEAPAVSSGGRQRVIVSGDTLWDISAQELGDPTRYMEIFNASNFSSGNPNLIFPGEVAIIP